MFWKAHYWIFLFYSNSIQSYRLLLVSLGARLMKSSWCLAIKHSEFGGKELGCDFLWIPCSSYGQLWLEWLPYVAKYVASGWRTVFVCVQWGLANIGVILWLSGFLCHWGSKWVNWLSSRFTNGLTFVPLISLMLLTSWHGITSTERDTVSLVMQTSMSEWVLQSLSRMHSLLSNVNVVPSI